jgi:hypothetical protein
MTQISNRPFDTINIDDFCKHQNTVAEDHLLLFAKA